MWFVQKLRSEYFPHRTNNWLIRASLYHYIVSLQETFEELSGIFGNLTQYHSKTNYITTYIFGDSLVNSL